MSPPSDSWKGISGLRHCAIFATLNLVLLSAAFSQDSRIVQIVSTVSLDSLLQTVNVLSGVEPAVTSDSTFRISSRWYGDNDDALRFIGHRLESYGYATATQSFDRGTNVFAVREGVTRPDLSVIICAHYDAVSGTPGADDNASGTAAVLEAARVLAPFRTEKTIVFALWDSEEIGLLGSAFYAQQAADEDRQIEAVINLDMIGWDDDGDGVLEIHADPLSASLAAALAGFAQTYTGGLTPTVYESGTSASDHASFWRNGYPAVLLIEEYYGGDFNRFYHQPADSVQRFNAQFFLQSASLGIASIAELAGVVSMNTGVPAKVERADVRLTAYPAPFSKSITVQYRTASASDTHLAAYDVTGRRVAVLVDRPHSAGQHEYTWVPANLPPGLYLLRLETGTQSRVLPVVMID